MAISKEELVIEEKKLSDTLSVINDQIEHASKKLFEGSDDYKSFQKVSWETYREMDSGERMNFFAENEARIGKLTEEEKYLKKLYKVKDSPYFGSLIFNDELIYSLASFAHGRESSMDSVSTGVTSFHVKRLRMAKSMLSTERSMSFIVASMYTFSGT